MTAKRHTPAKAGLASKKAQNKPKAQSRVKGKLKRRFFIFYLFNDIWRRSTLDGVWTRYLIRLW